MEEAGRKAGGACGGPRRGPQMGQWDPMEAAEPKGAGEQLDLEEPGERSRLGRGRAYMLEQEGDTYGLLLSLVMFTVGTRVHVHAHTHMLTRLQM